MSNKVECWVCGKEHDYCPTCGALVANGNSRVGFMNKVSKGYDRCAACGQAIDWTEGE